MKEQSDFERLVADQLASAAVGVPPESAIDDTIARAGGSRRLPEWLALIKEPPMRSNSNLAVGSPTVRVMAILSATLLLALALAAAGAGVQRLLAADGPIIVAQDGSGTAETIAEAVAMAEDGDEILVRPGTYVEAVTIDKDITVSGDGPLEEIVITAPEDGPEADISPDWFGTEPFAIQLLDTPATVSNLTLRGQRSVVHATGGSPTVTGLHLDSVGTAYRGGGHAGGNSIMVNAGSTATISGNTLTDGGPIGVFDLSAPLIEANTLTGGPHMWGGYGDGAVIRANTIDGSFVRGILVRNPAEMTIEGNTISNPGSNGLEVRGGPTAVVDNSISDASMAAVAVSGRGEVTVRGNELEDNGVGISWAAEEGVIEQNAVDGNKAGIVVSTGSPIVRDNAVEGSDARGIAVLNLAAPVLSGNTSCGNGENLYIADLATLEDDGTNEICEDAATE